MWFDIVHGIEEILHKQIFSWDVRLESKFMSHKRIWDAHLESKYVSQKRICLCEQSVYAESPLHQIMNSETAMLSKIEGSP